MEERMIDLQNKCAGCGGCEVICPTGAVTLERTQDGFYQASNHVEQCIDCGLCDRICPVLNIKSGIPLKAFSFKAKDKNSIKKSASGGFGYELSKAVVKEKPVCSVYYDSVREEPVHAVRCNIEDLEKNRNSFYLQSYPVGGMRDILKYKEGMFVGTPCQVAAMDNILKVKKMRNNYLLVDFFCHGVPSYNVWKKYLNQYKGKLNNPVTVEFRNKKNGWGKYTILLDDGNKKIYSEKTENKDLFYRIFLENMALQEACYTCPYHAKNSCADIRMGDFWGEKYKEDIEGVTALIVYTEKGAHALSKMQDSGELKVEALEDILSGQIQKDLSMPSCRKELLQVLHTDKSIKQINNSVILKYKIKRKLNRLLKRDI